MPISEAKTCEHRKIALQHAIDYVEAIINTDISRVDDVARNPQRARMLLRSLARNISTLATITTIRNDLAMGDEESLSDKTVSNYMNALNRIFVTEDLPAWNPERLLEDFEYFGFMFESLCDRDLRIYAEANDGEGISRIME